MAVVRMFTFWREHLTVALRSAREFGVFATFTVCSAKMAEPIDGKSAKLTPIYRRLTALFRDYPGEPIPCRKVKSMWILLKQVTVSGSGISWAICKSGNTHRQITTPAPQPLSFHRPDAVPAAQPTASKH